MTVWVVEIAGIATPEAIPCGVCDYGAGMFGLRHNSIHLFLRANDESDRNGPQPSLRGCDVCVIRERYARIECKDQVAVIEVEEDDRAVFELFARDPFGGQTESVPVEEKRPFEIADAQCQYLDVWSHL